jgi:uncharacterized delta-60 repeat protein
MSRPSTSALTRVSLAVLCVIAVSCGGASDGTTTGPPVVLPIASVTITPTSPIWNVGATQQFTATTLDANGATLTGRVVTWTTSDTTKATVSSTGLATGIGAGAATIKATSEGKSASASITVTAVSTAGGQLDTAFNGTGKVITAFGTNEDVGRAIALQADGKIVVVGTSTVGSSVDFAVARYNTDGSLDPSFDSDGKVITFITGAGSIDVANAVAIQTDGKIVVAGRADGNLAVVRYNTDGSLDAAFGTGGKVTTTIVNLTFAANAVAIQADGKIVAGGVVGFSGGTSFGLARYTTNGTLDTSFDTDGLVRTDNIGAGCCGSSSYINAIAIQSDGKIVAAGAATSSIALGRYNTDGSLDTSFDTDGVLTTNVPYTSTTATSVLIQPNGKIIAAGSSDGTFALFRYASDGALETIFERTHFTFDMLTGAALQSDGKIVTVGYIQKYASTNNDIVVHRYNADGSFDSTFGTTGRVVTPLGGGGAYGGGEFGGAHGMAIQADGKIVVAGSALTDLNPDFVVVRYRP